ncbi:MAG: creatininase family protein [Acidimicrobiia bacterium]
MKTYLPEMTYIEVSEAIERRVVALLPVGTIEGNAPHMPMGYDFLFAEAVAKRVAEKTGDIWLPGIAYGVSELLAGFPGTVFVPSEALQTQVESILRSLIRHGFEHILLVSNHIPNQYPIEYACRKIRSETGIVVASTYPGLLAKALGKGIFDNAAAMGHGAEPGTSVMMHLTPGAMRMDLVQESEKVESFAGFDFVSPFAVGHQGSEVNIYLDLHELTGNGAMADPIDASEAKGAEIMSRIVDFVASFVEKFRDVDTKVPTTLPFASQTQESK